MNSLVIYDSMFGNTEKIAKAVADGLKAKLIHVDSVNAEELKGLDILVIGSPVHGGRASENLLALFKKIKKDSLKNVKVTAFDTCFETNTHGLGLKIVMNVIGFAAGRIAKELVNKGGILLSDPIGFFVLDKEGPLKDGELERAKEWGEMLKEKGYNGSDNEK